MEKKFDYSWQVSKKISKKSKKLKIFLYIFLWGFFIFSSLVSADYYFFYKENKKYIFDQVAGFELIWENLKINLDQKNFSWVKKNFWDLEKKFYEFEKKILEKIYDKKFLIWSEKILYEWKKIFEDSIILWKNFLEIEDNFKDILNKNFDYKNNPIEKIFELNKINLEIVNKITDPGVSLKNIIINRFLPKQFDLKTPGSVFKELDNNKMFISQILWKNSPQTSVVFFQNSNESRVTWGFVWSFVIFTANNWKILEWKVHDIYEFDWQLKWNFEKIPFEAKSLVWDNDWSLRDFNSNPDLWISSNNFNYFFEKSWWKTIDNFFYLDSKILWEILGITWPIELNNLWISIDSHNWDFVFQFFVESKKNFEIIWISPKKFMIWEIISSLKENILDKKNINNLEKFFYLKNEILEKKYLQFYSKNLEINNLFKKNITKKSDKINNTIQKYFISISWNKSDKFIKNKWINWKENSSEKVISVKREFLISINEKKEFESFFDFLFKKFWSDIPKTELKRILWFWDNNSVLHFYIDKNGNEYKEGLDLLFVKFTKKNWEIQNLKYSTWKEGNGVVFEINLPILKIGEKQEVFFNFKK